MNILNGRYSILNKTRVKRTPLKIGGELRFSGRVDSYCSTSGTRHQGRSKSIKLRNFLENGISLGHDISPRADRLKG
jgi:hypothetical protein